MTSPDLAPTSPGEVAIQPKTTSPRPPSLKGGEVVVELALVQEHERPHRRRGEVVQGIRATAFRGSVPVPTTHLTPRS